MGMPAEEGAASLASTVLDLITTYAVPYWDRYSTLDDLVKHFAAGDPVLCRGDWHWKCAAAYVLLGRPGEAVECLRGWSGQASGETARRVKAAIMPPVAGTQGMTRMCADLGNDRLDARCRTSTPLQCAHFSRLPEGHDH